MQFIKPLIDVFLLRQIRVWRGLALCAAIAVALAVGAFGIGQSAEQFLQVERDGLSLRPATGDIHIVEIDAQSLKKLSEWPWPRRYHAQLIDKLREADAAQIAFDVDFSSTSRAGDDAALAGALARADGAVILPTHRQSSSSNNLTGQGGVVESLPIEMFRKNAFMASVNVIPDDAGQINQYLFGTFTQDTPRPSLAAMLAGKSGVIGESFRIDQSIDPDTIPRHSFAAILDGSADMSAIAGKHVVIGATAIEIGDRYGTASHGVQPGVVIQAMAAETLLQGRANGSYGYLAILAFAIVTTLLRFLFLRRHKISGRTATAAQGIVILGLPYLLENRGLATVEIVPALCFLTLVYAAHVTLDYIAALGQARTVDRDTGLPNTVSLISDAPETGNISIAILRIANYSDIIAILDSAERSAFVRLVAERLSMASANGVVYRTDSNSLAWVTPTSDKELMDERFEAVAAIMRSQIQMQKRSISLKVNIGAADGPTADVQQLVMEAQVAAEHAAKSGDRWIWHDDSISDAAEAKLSVLFDLERAMADHELTVAYQPKWDIAGNCIKGAEALVRWNHPEKGYVRPDQFIPVLESEGRIDEMTLYVMREVIDDIDRWNTAGHKLNIAINVSATLLTDKAFMRNAVSLLQEAPVDASQITIEVTESAALANPEAAIATLEQFKQLGARISVDDYGTGQSTLSYLQRFPADEIKIDQAFVKSMEHVEADRIMVRSTIELAHALGFSVVAEGVEDKNCMDLLCSFDCDTIQGWHIGKPVSAENFEAAWLQDSADEAAAPYANIA